MKRWNSLLGMLLLAVGAAGQGVVDTTAKSLRSAGFAQETVRGRKEGNAMNLIRAPRQMGYTTHNTTHD